MKRGQLKWLIAGLLLLAMAACAPQSADIQASGVIEAKEFSVAAETSGKVADVLVDEGDSVKAGEVLLRLDGSLLDDQRTAAGAALDAAKAGLQTAQAGVDTAQAQYDAALDAALAAEQSSGGSALTGNHPTEFDQPGWYFSQDERIQAAQAEITAAKTAVEDAQSRLDKTEQDTDNAEFMATEQRLAEARAAFQVAQQVQTMANGTGNTDLQDAAKDALDDARDELNDAQDAYDDALTTDQARDVLEDRAKLAVAQQRYDTARLQLSQLSTGEYEPEVVAASKALNQAKTLVDQAQANQAAAEASLALIDAQIAKLEVTAQVDGVILVRSIQPGEVLVAGTPAFTLGQLDELKVTVYLPEDRYGQVNVGDVADLSVDSFPDETFGATVTRIADQAEYTPRNVQTKEERQTTVYAIELRVDNADGKLKPGMQADVTFAIDSSN